MRAFIIANVDSRLIDQDKLSRIPIVRNDLAVYMNVPTCRLNHNYENILLLRGAKVTNDYWGEKELIGKEHLYNSIVFVQGKRQDKEVSRCKFEYPNDKLPTTGFIAYKYYLSKGYDVYLVNFIGPKEDLKQHWDGHQWEYEENRLYIEMANRIYCLK
jgi:hypothetical protein